MEELKPETKWGRMVDFKDRIPKNAVNKKDFFAIMIVMFVLIVVGFVYLLVYVNRLQVQLDETKYSLQQQMTMNAKQSSASAIAPSVIEKNESGTTTTSGLYNKLQWRVLGKNTFNRTATLMFSAIPTEYTDSTVISFKVTCDGQYFGIFDAVKDNEPTFEAYVDVPMVSIVEVEVIMKDKGVKKVEVMDTINLHDYFLLKVSNESTASFKYLDGKLGLDATMKTQIIPNTARGDDVNKMKKIDIVFYTNGNEIKKIPVDLRKGSLSEDGNTMTYSTVLPKEFDVKAGRFLEVRMEAVDTLGFKYNETIERYLVNKEGEITSKTINKKTIQ